MRATDEFYSEPLRVVTSENFLSFSFKRAMEVSWRSLLLEISLGISDMGEGGWFIISNPRWEWDFSKLLKVGQVQKILNS